VKKTGNSGGGGGGGGGGEDKKKNHPAMTIKKYRKGVISSVLGGSKAPGGKQKLGTKSWFPLKAR